MAGIYLHIPFCRKLCYYCDFHFSVSLRYKDEVLEAMYKELIQRSEEWNEESFTTIYFGGGTPSVLSIDEINKFFAILKEHYSISEQAEISFEANPDDLPLEYLSNLYDNTPINRLSIGIQSFNDRDLKIMNRRHNGIEAYNCIQNAQKAGFDNISLDLIYGTPGMSDATWEDNLNKAFRLGTQHLSSYHLTFEPKTMFSKFLKKGTMKEVAESKSVKQFEILLDKTKNAGFEHYEISNFAKDGAYSKHNSSYWNAVPYAGFGPSAHSFHKKKRRWNVSNNTKYIRNIGEDLSYFEEEELDERTLFNEYILTSLRTKWGININKVNTQFDASLSERCLSQARKFLDSEHLILLDNYLILTDKGKLVSDYLLKELFILE